MLKALITGIYGQDGSYLAKFLLEKGYQVFGTTRKIERDNLGHKYLGIHKDIHIVELNDYDKLNLKRLLNKIKPDEVFHLAAQSSVGESFKNPNITVEFNIISTLNFLDTIKESFPHTKFYHASSSEMFGNINQLPVSEDSHFHPSSPYGISKAAAHWLTKNYREGFKIFACCGILFNHESALRGDSFVTSKIINEALKIKKGQSNKLRLGNLNIYRDWGYAPKYVEAMWLMMQVNDPVDYLICSNNIMSLEDFAKEVFKELGLDYSTIVESDPTLYRAVDLLKIQGDNSRAQKELGWKYQMSNSELIKKLIDDYIDFDNWRKSSFN